MILREIKRETKKMKNVSDVDEMVKALGWMGYTEADGVLKRTISLIASIEKVIQASEKGEERNEWFWDEVDFTAESRPSMVYGKVYDLMWFRRGNVSITITYNMYGDSTKYVGYRTGVATPLAKMRNRKEVAEFLKNKLSD